MAEGGQFASGRLAADCRPCCDNHVARRDPGFDPRATTAAGVRLHSNAFNVLYDDYPVGRSTTSGKRLIGLNSWSR
jgi:hypothetical protein